MKAVQTYLLRVIGVSLLVGLAPKLVPSGLSKKVLPFIGMLLMVTVVLSPLMQLRAEDLSKSISQLYIETQEANTEIEIKNREILCLVIKQQLEAYILDRAQDNGINIQPTIILEETAEYPYPVAVCIEGAFTDAQKAYLSRILEDDLSIPLEEQEWVRQ